MDSCAYNILFTIKCGLIIFKIVKHNKIEHCVLAVRV